MHKSATTEVFRGADVRLVRAFINAFWRVCHFLSGQITCTPSPVNLWSWFQWQQGMLVAAPKGNCLLSRHLPRMTLSKGFKVEKN